MMAAGLVKLNRIYNLLLLCSFTFKPTPTRHARWLIISNIDYEKENCPRKEELVLISKKARWWKRSCILSIVYLTHSRLAAHLLETDKTSKVTLNAIISFPSHWTRRFRINSTNHQVNRIPSRVLTCILSSSFGIPNDRYFLPLLGRERCWWQSNELYSCHFLKQSRWQLVNMLVSLSCGRAMNKYCSADKYGNRFKDVMM